MTKNSKQPPDNYGLDPKRWEPVETKVIQPFASQTTAQIPPPANDVRPDNLRSSLPLALGLQSDLVATQAAGGPVTRLMPPRPSGVSPVNAATASTSKPLTQAAVAGVVDTILPGSVSKVGDPNFYFVRTSLGNGTSKGVADSQANNRYARTATHSSNLPLTNPLTSTDAGTSATVTIAPYLLQTPDTSLNFDGGQVSYLGGTIVGLSYGTLYYIWQTQLPELPVFSGGATNYFSSLAKAATLAPGTTENSSTNLFVGSITTATMGGGPTVGNGDGGSASNQTGLTANFGPTTQINPYYTPNYNAYVGVTNSGGQTTISSASLHPQSACVWNGFVNPVVAVPSSITLNVTSVFTLTGATGNAQLEYSTNAGTSFNVIYSATANRATTTDRVSIPPSTPFGNIYILAQAAATGALGPGDSVFQQLTAISLTVVY